MANQLKRDLIQKIFDLLDKYQNFALIKIDKTTHQTLESLRKELKKTESSLRIVKNTLLEKTINKLAVKYPAFFSLKKTFFPVHENSALLIFKNDWSKSMNTFHQFIQKEKSLSFKFALLDGKSYNDKQTLTISQLPGKDQLIANLIASFKSPTSRFVHVTNFQIHKLIYLLKEKSKKTG